MVQQKTLTFYVELLLVAIFGIVIANLWKDIMLRWIHETMPNSFKGEIVFATTLTLGAIIALFFLFGKSDKIKTLGLNSTTDDDTKINPPIPTYL